ncbi:MAG: DUF1570 domain-containing protein [Phycisphaerales bacterium JB039]
MRAQWRQSGLWCALLALGLAVASAPGPRAAASPARPWAEPSLEQARALIVAARAEANAGNWASADRALRIAWRAPEMRRLAAAALWDLHQRPGFALPVDEEAVSEAAARLGPRYQRFQTPHFVILTDADMRWSRSRATILEQTRRQFYDAMGQIGYPAAPHPHKLLCILMREHDQFRTFAANEDGHVADWSAGYYSTRANRVVFYNDDSSPALRDAMRMLDAHQQRVRQLRDQATSLMRSGRAADAQRRSAAADDLERQVITERSRLRAEAEQFAVAKTIHEAVHLLSFNSGVQLPSRQYPLWLSEGLACAFEAPTTQIAFGPRRPSPGREQQLVALYREQLDLPMDRVLRAVEAPAEARAATDAMYAQSFAMVEYLYVERPEALVEILLDLADGPDGALDVAAHGELLERLVGDPADLATVLRRRWLR